MLKARVTFRVMKLGRYVTVDDGGNYVTERSHKDKKKIITPHNESLGRLCCCRSTLATIDIPFRAFIPSGTRFVKKKNISGVFYI